MYSMSASIAIKCGQQESDTELPGLELRHVNSSDKSENCGPRALRFSFPSLCLTLTALHHGIRVCTRLFTVAAVCSPFARLR